MDSPSPNPKARQRILDAASEFFRTLGYARTTTQAIAEKAQVAEVTIFRHFGNKQQLFQAVIAQIGQAADFDRVEAQLIGDLYADLHLIAQQMLAFFFDQQETIRMLMFESSHFPEMRQALAQNPTRQLELLSRYFEQQAALGRVKNIPPQALAQTFISMLFGYAIALVPIQDMLPLDLSAEESVDHFVTIFLEGITPPED